MFRNQNWAATGEQAAPRFSGFILKNWNLLNSLNNSYFDQCRLLFWVEAQLYLLGIGRLEAVLHGITLRNPHRKWNFAWPLYPNHATFKLFALPKRSKIEDPLIYWTTDPNLSITMFMCHTVPQALILRQEDYHAWSTLTNQAIVGGGVTFHEHSYSRNLGNQSEKYTSVSQCSTNDIGSSLM